MPNMDICKNSYTQKVFNYFRKKLRLRCLLSSEYASVHVLLANLGWSLRNGIKSFDVSNHPKKLFLRIQLTKLWSYKIAAYEGSFSTITGYSFLEKLVFSPRYLLQFKKFQL